LEILIFDLKVDLRQAVVITIVTEAGVDTAEPIVVDCLGCLGKQVTSISLNDEGLVIVVVEELGDHQGLEVGVHRDHLLLQFFPLGGHVVGYLQHDVVGQVLDARGV
jgi:hypothetical protein